MRERVRELRCAVYTRKSSEEGLEQDFNSLQAQREACEAYVLSQRHEGWRVLPGRYDDGGYSGGSMDRPGLTALLADVAAGRIDVVVVYKVDRLTRSLTDFARIVEVFDRAGVSFVSVTQAFNTTSSMGRLTLNVLLSFAQFEREVTGERIRDKIAASKRKGLWMGGLVPLGYEAAGRTLVVNEAEATTVRVIYERYLALRSVDALAAELEALGLRTKVRAGASRRNRGGVAFSRGHLYRILSNPLYAGRIRHKGQVYAGQHPAIVSDETWVAVQAGLRANGHERRLGTRAGNPSPLAGLLRDETGRALRAVHASKGGQRYRYYVSSSRAGARGQQQGGQGTVWRLPAAEIEGAVERILTAYLSDEHGLSERLGTGGSLHEHQRVLTRAAELRAELAGSDPTRHRAALLALVDHVGIRADAITLVLRRAAFGCTDEDGDKGAIAVVRALAVRQRGHEARLVIEGDRPSRVADPALTKALAQAYRWWGDLVACRYATMRDLARAYDTDERYVARVVPLAFLPRDLTQAILVGEQPPEMTLRSLFDIVSA
ncbi:recombinase family protein [Salinarimonas soli]|uniref:Recombinase family protein n=1 Tax=Salinarimonas soli TaxID=1638099 RepID=A0A5B2VCF6_9HYPH|nr:recombinase family protein [Salinarimonas soli]KAA2236438.1 recombinase family protein [Salinarimonas soli]